VAGLALRARLVPLWAWSVEVAAAGVALVVVAIAYSTSDADVAGVALVAYSPIAFTAGVRERRWPYAPAAVALGLAGMFTLLADHRADTLLYPAALGAVGLIAWIAARLLDALGAVRDEFVEASRWLGVGSLVVAGAAGFAFPDRTGAGSAGAALAAAAFIVSAAILALDARHFALPQNLYAGLVVGSAAGFFLAREAGLREWELFLPGLGLIACGVLLRGESRFQVPQRGRQALVTAGALLAMGWALVQTVTGDPFWMVLLLLEGSAAVAAGIVVRSRVLLSCGAGGVALVSLRALLNIAQAGYLFVAFAVVALFLLAVASALALGHDRLGGPARGLREQLTHWD
jgi:hypothetical protein